MRCATSEAPACLEKTPFVAYLDGQGGKQQVKSFMRLLFYNDAMKCERDA